MFVRSRGRGQLSSEWRHSESDVIVRMGAANDVIYHNENDVIMIIAGLGDTAMATCCNALVRITFSWFITNVVSPHFNQSMEHIIVGYVGCQVVTLLMNMKFVNDSDRNILYAHLSCWCIYMSLSRKLECLQYFDTVGWAAGWTSGL